MMKYKNSFRVLNSDDSPSGVSVEGFALNAADPFVHALVVKESPCPLKLTLLSMFIVFRGLNLNKELRDPRPGHDTDTKKTVKFLV